MDQPIPNDRTIDGSSLVPILTGQTEKSPHEFLIHYCQDVIHAIRWRPPEGNLLIKIDRLMTEYRLKASSLLSLKSIPNSLNWNYLHVTISGTSVWKVRLATPRWVNGSDTCGAEHHTCACTGPTVRWHKERPLLFDMTNNPREDEPTDFNDPRYVEYVSKAARALENHFRSLDPNTEDQFTIRNTIWRPYLQPCCNFPSCTCTDPKYP